MTFAWFILGVIIGASVVALLPKQPPPKQPEPAGDPRGLDIRNCESFIDEDFVQRHYQIRTEDRPEAIRRVHEALRVTTTRKAWVELSFRYLDQQFGKKVTT